MTTLPHPKSRSPRLALWLFAAAALALPGCMVVQSGAVTSALVSGGAGTSASAPTASDHDTINDAWPERWGCDGKRIKGVIEPVEGPLSDLAGVRLGEHHQLRAAEEERASVARLSAGEPGAGLYRFRAEGPGSYVFVRKLSNPTDPRSPEELERRKDNPDEPAAMFRFISAQRAASGGDVPHLEIERTWFALYDPAPEAPPRGVIVLLPGMFGTPQPVIHTTVRRFRAAGWTVLRMLSHPGRFTQKSRFEIDSADIDAAAASIARTFNQRAAEVAYAVDGAVEHVHHLRPELEDLRHVLLGMSGGAMALPTVHARSPELYDGAILVAGGANFLRINMDSNYASWIDSVELEWGEGSSPAADRDALLEAYLAHAALDSASTATLLRDKPVLMLHAARDKAVPAATGEELWRLLGEPERWIFPVGHELIFIALPMQLDRIIRWLDENIPAGKAAADPGS